MECAWILHSMFIVELRYSGGAPGLVLEDEWRGKLKGQDDNMMILHLAISALHHMCVLAGRGGCERSYT